MRSVTTVGVVTGPLIVMAYLIGSLTRWQNPLRGRSAPTGPDEATGTDTAAAAHLPARTQAFVDVGLVVVAYWVAEQVVRAVAPGVTFSRVASLSFQVLFVWDSVALWCSLAAVVAIVAPPWTRFRGGGDALLPVLVLLLYRAPFVGLAGIAGFVVGTLLLGSTRRAVPLALAAAATGEWLLWIFDVYPPWGVPNGPELSLWTTVLAAVLFARWLRGDVLATPERPDGDQ